MLDLLNFNNPQFNSPDPNLCPINDNTAFTAINPQPAQVVGHILARDVDSNGRVIAFVFPGDNALDDGSDVTVDAALISASVNATLLAEGLAYPTLYTSMPPDLRPVFADLTRQARAANLGIWPNATMSPNSSTVANNACALQSLIAWPKLFRRLITFFTSGQTNINEFETWLRAKPSERDDAMILPNGDFGNLHDMVDVTAAGLRTVFQPEDVVIVPDDPIVTINPFRPRFPRRDVRILAALVNPVPAIDTGLELITLLNSLPFDVDLNGWQLVTISPPPQRLEKRQALNGTLTAGAVTQVVWTTDGLRNKGSEIQLVNDRGAPVDAVVYNESQAGCVGQTIIF